MFFFRRMNADELYIVIIQINIEIQKLLTVAVSKHAVEHPDAKSLDPKIAFSEVLSEPQNLSLFKENVKLFKVRANMLKLFQINGKNLLPSIDISRFDSSFLIQTLLHVEEFFDESLSVQTAIATSTSTSCNGINCPKKCCKQCNHASTDCKKCESNSGKPTKKCHHPCKHCKNSEDYCDDYSEICCNSCNLCNRCNKEALCIKESNIINKQQKAVILCPLTEYKKGLQILQIFRNLFGHILKADCDRFLQRKQTIGDFLNIHSYEELSRYIIYAFEAVLRYITCASSFKTNKFAVDSTVQEETQKNINCIFKYTKSPEQQLIDIAKFKEVFQIEGDIINEIIRVEKKIIKRFDSLESDVSEIKDGVKYIQSQFQSNNLLCVGFNC